MQSAINNKLSIDILNIIAIETDNILKIDCLKIQNKDNKLVTPLTVHVTVKLSNFNN